MKVGNFLFALIAFLGTCFPVLAGSERIASPDGKLEVIVTDGDGLNYQVALDGKLLLNPSRLGLELVGKIALGPKALIEKADRTTHKGSWENRFGKRRIVPESWKQLRFTLLEKGEPQRRFGLIVRVFDNGVAFRYDLPDQSGLGNFVLTRELTQFSFAGDYRCWAGEPSSCAESNYLEHTLSTIPQKEKKEEIYKSVLPLLVQAPNCCVAVAESDLLDWAGMFVTGTGSPTVSVTLDARIDGRGCVVSQAPRVSPWRVLMITRTASELVSTDLVATLATPCKLADISWIKPGVAAWDPWWTGVNPHLPQFKGLMTRGDTKAHKEYIDFAAEMGWPYQVLDWFWYENMTSYDVTLNLGGKNPPRPPVDFARSMSYIDMPAILKHAKERDVRLIIWVHAYDIHRYGIEKACAYFAGLGAAGLKIDFMNSDSQETVKWYEEVVATAARHKLLIDFHGAYKPTGLARTYPNFITQEGVLGNEYNKLEGNKCTPQHTINLPFTRGLLGPMDFTPGGFINVPASKFKIADPCMVMGTRARQLAMPVIYESPLQLLCDSPANYRGAKGVEFYRGLPTVWDDTVVPSAELARHVVLARRSGERWWLAAMNGNDALKVRAPLRFLGSGQWNLRSFQDTPESAARPTDLAETSQIVTSEDTIEISLAPAGGFAGILSKRK